MTAIFQTEFWNASFEWKCLNFDQDFTDFLFLGVQLTIFLTGDKPLSGPMMAYFTNAYMRHSASMSWTTVEGIDEALHPTWKQWFNYIFMPWLESNQVSKWVPSASFVDAEILQNEV